MLTAEPRAASAELVDVLEAELRSASEPHRIGRLHYELGQCYEHMHRDRERALGEYTEALALIPDHLPSLRGAYRTALALDRKLDACDILRAETAHTSDPTQAARVHYRLGLLYEQQLDDIAAAREAYEAAHSLCPNEPTYLKTLERVYRRVGDWPALSSILEEHANVAGDVAHRVALTVERARLHEARLDDRAAAAELYQAAKALMPEAPGVVEALVRLHRANANVSGLVEALEQAAALAEDPRERAEHRYHRGRIQSDRLGDRVSAIDSLEAAVKDAPDEALLMDALAELHRRAGNRSRLAELLSQRVEVTVDPGERAALLHRLGQVLEANGEVGKAIAAYKQAVELAPTCVPALQALGARLAEQKDWESLVAMHRAEAEAVQSTRRRASAHRRMGELLERRLAQPAEAAKQYALALTLEPGDPGSFKALVRLWAELGEHRKLIEIYERAVDETTSSPRKIAYLFKIGALWEDALDEPAQAIGAYARVLQLADSDLGAIHALQRVCERAERYAELVDYLLLEADLTDDETLLLALRHRAAEVLDDHLQEPERARVLLEQILANDPGHLPAVIALGRIHYRAGRWRELMLMYESELAVTADGRDRAILSTRMGELCEQKFGDAGEAIAHYERATEDDPMYRPATTALMRLLTEAGDRSALLERLQTRMNVLETPSERAQLALQMAHLREDDGDLEGAIQCCRAALAEQEQYRPAARVLEQLLEHAERHEELETLLQAEADSAAGPRRALVSALRRGELLRDELHQPGEAIEAYLAARQAGAKLSALVPLAALYAQAGQRGPLIDVETEVAGEVDQRAERAAALREVVRLLTAEASDDNADLIYTCEAILQIAPDDADALLLLAELATRGHDSDRLVRMLARLGRVSPSAEMAADYWLRLAQVYEAGGDERAVATYRSVLEKVPNSLAAALGLERVAERAFDSETQAFALRCQAGIISDPQTAAARLVASAELDTDSERSVADLERALELWPDSARGAAAITRLLGEDERERLIDLLSRAAGSARTPERRAALWHAVAEAYADQRDLGAAIAAVSRGLVAVSDDVPCLHLLADLYGRNDQWNEAIAVLDTVAHADSVPMGVRRSALVQQAELSEQKLGKPDVALARARAALELEPLNRSVLALVARLENANGRPSEAEAIAHDLLSVSSGPREQADALCVLGEIEARGGSVDDAVATLAKAVAITGAGGRAYSTLRTLVRKNNDWHALATALEQALHGDQELDDVAATHLALADVYVTMELPGKAVAALEHGFAATHARGLAQRLAKLIPKASPAIGAAEQLRVMLEHVPDEPALWRSLARCASDAGRTPDARRAVGALVALSALQPGDRKLAAGDAPRTAEAGSNSFDGVALNAAVPHGAAGRPVAGVVAALAEAVARVAEVSHPVTSLSRRERIAPRSKHPLSALFDRLVAATGVQAELYVRAGLSSPAVAICGDTPAILVDEALVSRPVAEQCFLLARPLVLATLRLHPVIAVPARTLEALATEIAGLNGGDTELAKQARKALPRRQRKALELAVAAYAQQPEVDFAGWRRAIVDGANRVASILADDVGAAVAALTYVRDEGAPPPKRAPPRSVVTDLLGFWMSDTAQQLRRRGGL